MKTQPKTKQKITTVLFDLDNTLYPYHENHVRGVKAAHTLYRKKHPCSFAIFLKKFAFYENQNNKLLPNRATAHDRRLFFQHLFEQEHGAVDYQLVLDMFDAYWDAMIKDVKLDEGARELLFWLRSKNIKIGLITDLTVDVQFKKLVAFRLQSAFNAIVTSEEAGVEKPDKKIFQLCLKKLKSKSSESIMIGDNIKRDILGAQNMKMQSIWIRREQPKVVKIKPTYTVSYIKNVKEILVELLK